MHKFLGMIAISAIVIVMAGSTRAGSPSSYTLTPTEPSNALTIQPVAPVARAGTQRPQPGEIIYNTQPLGQAETQIIIPAPNTTPRADQGNFVITPVPNTAQ